MLRDIYVHLILSNLLIHRANIWYSHNGERLGTLDGHEGSIMSIDVDVQTYLVATGSGDGTARLWDIKTGTQLFTWNTLASTRYVAFSPKGDRLLLVTDENFGCKSKLQIFNLNRETPTKQSEEPVLVIENQDGPKAKYMVAAWTSEGENLLVGLNNGEVKKFSLSGEKKGEAVKSIKAHDEAVSDLQTSLDRSYFITSSRDKLAKLFDSESLENIHSYEGQAPLNSACITTVKDFVIVGGGQDASAVTTTADQEGDFKSKIFHKIFEDHLGDVKGHFGPINTLAADPKGRSFTSGGEDGFIRLHHFDPSYFEFYYDIERRNKEELAAAN